MCFKLIRSTSKTHSPVHQIITNPRISPGKKGAAFHLHNYSAVAQIRGRIKLLECRIYKSSQHCSGSFGWGTNYPEITYPEIVIPPSMCEKTQQSRNKLSRDFIPTKQGNPKLIPGLIIPYPSYQTSPSCFALIHSF